MRVIKEISERIKAELEDAELYFELAIKCKHDYPELAKIYHELGKEELAHMDKLHTSVVKVIKEQRSKEEPPAYMLEMWNEQHKSMLKEYAEVKVLGESFASA